MYVYMDVGTYLYMYECIYVCVYACVYVCMYVCMNEWMYVCMYVCRQAGGWVGRWQQFMYAIRIMNTNLLITYIAAWSDCEVGDDQRKEKK